LATKRRKPNLSNANRARSIIPPNLFISLDIVVALVSFAQAGGTERLADAPHFGLRWQSGSGDTACERTRQLGNYHPYRADESGLKCFPPQTIRRCFRLDS
jgi:hypothetical protein